MPATDNGHISDDDLERHAMGTMSDERKLGALEEDLTRHSWNQTGHSL